MARWEFSVPLPKPVPLPGRAIGQPGVSTPSAPEKLRLPPLALPFFVSLRLLCVSAVSKKTQLFPNFDLLTCIAYMAKRGFEKQGSPNSPNLPQGNNYLLVIGINDYQHFRPLNNAVRDATTIRDLLLNHYQFEAAHTTTLLDSEATRENILETLYEFEEKLTPEDNFLLYFAGHGAMNSKKSQGFWIPVEAEQKRSQYLSNARIREVLKDLEAHHIYLVVDSCFSGSMILREGEKVEHLVESLPSRRVLTSGRKQVVADGPPEGHSPFAQCIIHYLSSNAAQAYFCLGLGISCAEKHPTDC